MLNQKDSIFSMSHLGWNEFKGQRQDGYISFIWSLPPRLFTQNIIRAIKLSTISIRAPDWSAIQESLYVSTLYHRSDIWKIMLTDTRFLLTPDTRDNSQLRLYLLRLWGDIKICNTGFYNLLQCNFIYSFKD